MQSMGECYGTVLKGSKGPVSLPAPPLPGPSNSKGVALNSFVKSGARPLEAHLFQYAKLPNPIQRILSGQPTLSGDTFESVLQFLKLLVEVKIHAAVLSIPDVPILQILYILWEHCLTIFICHWLIPEVPSPHFNTTPNHHKPPHQQ
jgi:hypothetical protein